MDQNEHEHDVQLAPMKKDGNTMMDALASGRMVAILSKGEIMYAFEDSHYECYIHPIGAEEGRCKRFEKTEENRAVVKHLADLADQLFEISYAPQLHPLGVMAAAEQGIVNFLDAIGQLPCDDFDFMSGETIKRE